MQYKRILFYGPEGIRTLGLCVANAALSQLSYEPVTFGILTHYEGKCKPQSGFYFYIKHDTISPNAAAHSFGRGCPGGSVEERNE